jgi:hypothetical protein
MIDHRDALEQARRALRPPQDAFERLLERRDRKVRNRRIAAGILGLVIVAGGLSAAVIASRDGSQVGSVATCSPTQAGLTGWWPGDGGTSDVVAGRDATLHGDATFGSGRIGQAFVLDGDGDFVSVPHNPALDFGTADFTVALWVNFNTTEGEQILVEKWVQRSLDRGSHQIGWTFTKLENDRFGFGLDPGAVGSARLDIPPRTWIHLAARRSGNRVEILMNGNVVASGTAPEGVVIDADSRASLKFGHRGGPDDTPRSIDERGFFLDGRIDEVKVFAGRALSDEEIRADMDADANGMC